MSISFATIGQFLDNEFTYGELAGTLPVGSIRRLERTLDGVSTTVVIKHAPVGTFSFTISAVTGHWSIHYLEDKALRYLATEP